MNAPPAVVVHGLSEVRSALAPGRPVTLLSAPGAALYAGCAWWQALVSRARAEHPGIAIADILDCSDAAGRALEAMRGGLRRLVLEACPGRDDAATAAASCGATLLLHRPPALDLARPGAERRLAAWLAASGGRPPARKALV